MKCSPCGGLTISEVRRRLYMAATLRTKTLSVMASTTGSKQPSTKAAHRGMLTIDHSEGMRWGTKLSATVKHWNKKKEGNLSMNSMYTEITTLTIHLLLLIRAPTQELQLVTRYSFVLTCRQTLQIGWNRSVCYSDIRCAFTFTKTSSEKENLPHKIMKV